LGFDEVNPTVERGEVDFILANPSIYVELEYSYGASRIATLNNLRLGKAHTVFGGTVFCRADRKDLRQLKDLKGHTLMAVEESSFGGWQTSWRELKEYGIDPYEDFADLSFGGTHDSVIYAVRDGIVDAGCVRTDALERMDAEGKISLEDFHVFHEHGGGKVHLPFVHSTRSYPEWPFAKVDHVSDQLAKEVTATLLKMSPDDPAAVAAKCAGWTIPHNYQPVHECLKYLRVGPYKDYGKVTLQDVLRQYRLQLVYAFVTVCLIILFAFRVVRLNRKLNQAVLEQVTRARQQSRAAEFGQLALSGVELDELFEKAVSLISETLDTKYAKVLEHIPDQHILCLRTGVGWQEGWVGRKSVPDGAESQGGYTLLQDKPVITEDVGKETRFVPPALLTEHNIVGGITVAIGGSERPFGVLGVHTDRMQRFTENDAHFMETIANILAEAIQRAYSEEQLRFERDYSTNIIKGTPTLICDIAPDGTTNSINPAGEMITGYRSEDIVGQNWWRTLYPDDDYRQIEQLFRNFGKDSVLDCETTLTGKDGEKHTVVWNSFNRLDANARIVETIGFGQDITERKLVEEALRESEERFKKLSNLTFEGILFHDKGVAIDVNESLTRILSYTREEMIGENIVELCVPREYHATIRENIAKRHAKPYEVMARKKDGTLFPIEIEGRSVIGRDDEFRVTAIRDITERKLAEGALKENEMRYRMLFESAGDAILMMDGEQFVDCNAKTLEIFGCTRDQIIGAPPYQYSPAQQPDGRDSREESLKNINHALSSGPHHFEWLHCRHDGTPFHAEVSLSKVELSGKSFLQAIVRDISNRKRAEEALRESEERYRLILGAIQVGVVLIDAESHTIIDVNPVAIEMIGIQKEEIVGKICHKFICPAEKGRCPITDLGEAVDNSERVLIRADGISVPILKTVVPITINGRGCLLDSFIDITDRKQAEAALRESEERFRAIFETAKDSIFIKDRNLRYTQANPAMEALFSMPVSEITGKTDGELFGEEAGGHIRAVDTRVLGGEIIQEEHTKPVNDALITFNVVKVPMRDTDGDVIGLCGIARDVTDRKQAEEEIRKFKTISDSASHGVAIIDVDGKIAYINECFARMHGYTATELIGKNLSVFHNEEQMESVRGINEELRENGNYSSREVWHKHRDGTVFPTLMNGVAIKDEDGNVLFMAGMASDITEIRRLREQKSRAERLETAGTVAGQVAHDFNNLLGPMMAYPELMRMDLPKNHKALAYLESMENAASQMAEINQQLLTLGRRGHYNLQPLNINEIVLHAVKELGPLPDTLVCEADLAEDLMNISGGNAQIYRVITNLLHNARDAVNDIGTIYIKTENFYAEDVTITYGQVPKGEYVKLTITDNGCGIPDNIIQKIFDPFFTSKATDKKRGSGLGMSVVSAVLKDHSGYIDLSTKEGEGTSFYLYFPITRESVDIRESSQGIGGSESILIVDDDDAQREVSGRLLGELGYKVSVAENGDKAIEFLKDNPQDILILDMVMPPGIDGTETYQRILEFSPEQKAIIVSGYSETERVMQAQKLGAGAFVKKPITLKAIAAAVRTELDRKVEIAAY
ncbi:MAG: hypothetical protein DRP45_01305, partial [Candidatus Zixiibacteriota bacterium]